MTTFPPAVVVGACSHGLAIARALHKRSVPVHLVESNTALPGTRTNAARLHVVPSVAGPELISSLQLLATSGHFDHAKPVLFLTNDRMVGQVARDWAALANHYCMSWSDCRDEVALLLEKSRHAAASERGGCLYPGTTLLQPDDDAETVAHGLSYPVIIKPSQPLSAFKVRVAETAQVLLEVCKEFKAAMPFVIQPFIAGGDDRIRFTAFYLWRGEPLARFDGRKLQSRPMGHTTIAEPYADPGAAEAALRFFRAAGISGPASLEVKQDEAGRYWVIEPTVGRTDFWLQLCVSNGVNLPWLEYCDVVGIPLAESQAVDATIWLNSDRDRAVLARYLGLVSQGRARLKPLKFSFLSWKDPLPFFAATRRNTVELAARFWRRLGMATK